MIHDNKPANRLEKTLTELKREGKKALAVFLMGGDPDLVTSDTLIRAAIKGGADIVEIGVPFSDPTADGPVIQKAAQRSLKNGTNINDIFKLVEQIRKDSEIPLALLIYYNIVYRFGLLKFIKQAKLTGVDAIIIPDLPFEEKKEAKLLAGDNNLIIIDFIAPTTSEKRMNYILKDARGFIYCVSVTGVTGMRKSMASGFKTMIQKARTQTDIPLLAGFGISSPEQAREVSDDTDGVIVGSVLVDEVEGYINNKDALPEIIRERVASFKKALL